MLPLRARLRRLAQLVRFAADMADQGMQATDEFIEIVCQMAHFIFGSDIDTLG